MESINVFLGDKNAHTQEHIHMGFHEQDCGSPGTVHLPDCKAGRICPSSGNLLLKCKLISKNFLKEQVSLSWLSLFSQFLAKYITADHHLCPSTERFAFLNTLARTRGKEGKKIYYKIGKQNVFLCR